MHSFPVSLALVSLFVPLLGLAGCGGAGSTAAPPSAQAGEKYPIVLRRELPPGKSYQLRVKDESTEHTVVSLQGKVVKDQTKTTLLSFVGSQQALSGGRDQPTDYVVEELTRTADGQKTALLPPGSKIAARPAGKEWQYTVEGQPAAEDVNNALQKLFGSSAGGPTDDDVFGSKQPRAVGESWSVDLTSFPADEKIELNPDGASGSTRFVTQRNVDGVACQELQADLSVPKVTLKGLPEGAKVLSVSLTGHFLGLYPVDTRLPSPSQGLAMDMKFKMEIASPQGPATVEASVHSDHTQNRN
jgi:hypothetical protein